MLRPQGQGGVPDFEVLWQKHRATLIRVVRPMARDCEEAEDFVQETAVRALEAMTTGKYKDEGHFLAWLCRIARNVVIDKHRRDAHLVPLEEGTDIPDPGSVPEAAATLGILLEFLDKQLDECLAAGDSPSSRKQSLLRKLAFSLDYVDGYALPEVAAFLSCEANRQGLPAPSLPALNNWLAGGRLLSHLMEHLLACHQDSLERLESTVVRQADLTVEEEAAWQSWAEAGRPAEAGGVATTMLLGTTRRKITRLLVREVAAALHAARKES